MSRIVLDKRNRQYAMILSRSFYIIALAGLFMVIFWFLKAWSLDSFSELSQASFPPMAVISLRPWNTADLKKEFPKARMLPLLMAKTALSFSDILEEPSEVNVYGNDDPHIVLACTASHINVIMAAAKREMDCVLVIEDDVIKIHVDEWPYDMNEICKNMKKDNVDIVLVGYTTIHKPFLNGGDSHNFADPREDDTRGTFAYLANPKNVLRRLRKNYGDHSGKFDIESVQYHVADYVLYHKQRVKVHVPAFIKQRSKGSMYEKGEHVSDELQTKLREQEWTNWLDRQKTLSYPFDILGRQ